MRLRQVDEYVSLRHALIAVAAFDERVPDRLAAQDVVSFNPLRVQLSAAIPLSSLRLSQTMTLVKRKLKSY